MLMILVAAKLLEEHYSHNAIVIQISRNTQSSVSGNSEIMHCGLLIDIDMPYCFLPVGQ